MSPIVRKIEDPRITRTRHLIVHTFWALVHEKGFQAVTVQDIAARATVNRATFYAHFDDKYALFAYATRTAFLELVQQRVVMTRPYDQNHLYQLVHCVGTFLAQLHQTCPQSFRAFEPMVATEMVAGIETILLAWTPQQIDMESNDLPDWKLTISIAGWGMYGVARTWILGQRPEPVDRFVGRVVPLLRPMVEGAMMVVQQD